MPDPFTAGLALISGIRSLSRRQARPTVRDVQIDDTGRVRIIWETEGLSGAIARALQRVQPEAEATLSAYARGERELSEAERRQFAGVIQFIDDWRAALRQPDERVPFEEPLDQEGQQFGGQQITPIGPEDYFVPRFVRNMHRSIPGGAAGMAQQTPATLTTLGPSLAPRFTGRVARRNGRTRRPARPVRRAARTRARNGKLVRGSPAAKRHMAKLRAMVGKRRRAKS